MLLCWQIILICLIPSSMLPWTAANWFSPLDLHAWRDCVVLPQVTPPCLDSMKAPVLRLHLLNGFAKWDRTWIAPALLVGSRRRIWSNALWKWWRRLICPCQGGSPTVLFVCCEWNNKKKFRQAPCEPLQEGLKKLQLLWIVLPEAAAISRFITQQCSTRYSLFF